MHMHVPMHDSARTDTQNSITSPARGSKAGRILSLSALGLVLALTVIGIVQLWPNFADVSQVAQKLQSNGSESSLETGEILDLHTGCKGDAEKGRECETATVGILTGPDSGQTVQLELRDSLAKSGLSEGDKLELTGFAPQDSSTLQEGVSQTYSPSGVGSRTLPVIILLVVFIAVLCVIGKLRGLLALAGVALSAAIVFGFILPALISGQPALLVGVVGSTAIMFVTLFLVHGASFRTISALIGTLFGIGVIALTSLWAVSATRLSGIGDEVSSSLALTANSIDFRGLLTCAILIAGLGVLNDVTITQASSVWELRAAAPTMSRARVFSSAMRIGRDHIASTVYTVFFAYVGAALSTLLLLYLIDRPLLDLLTIEDIATEVVRTLVGSIGLIVAAPVTTLIATLFLPAAQESPRTPWMSPPVSDPERYDAAK
jgi:uncharacterized membrane protein